MGGQLKAQGQGPAIQDGLPRPATGHRLDGATGCERRMAYRDANRDARDAPSAHQTRATFRALRPAAHHLWGPRDRGRRARGARDSLTGPEAGKTEARGAGAPPNKAGDAAQQHCFSAAQRAAAARLAPSHGPWQHTQPRLPDLHAGPHRAPRLRVRRHGWLCGAGVTRGGGVSES